MKLEKMRKVFLDDLPRWKCGGNKGRINWIESIGYKIKFVYDDIEDEVKIVDYATKTRNIYIKYKNDDLFEINVNNFTKCSFGNLLGKITNKFKIEIGQVFKDNKRDLIIIDREYREDNNQKMWKYYKYKCNKCGWDKGWIFEGNLSKGVGCSCCCNPPKTVVEGVNDIPTTDPWMIKFFQGGYDEAKLYTRSSGKKIYPICPDCGMIKVESMSIYNIYVRKHMSCPYCGDGKSYPEKLMFNILEQLHINFETEKYFEWCKYRYVNKSRKGYYDFYFEVSDNKYIIEADGGFHNNDNKMSGQTASDSKYIDECKDELAYKHKIKVIRIDCKKTEIEYIKNNILKSELNKIFDLSIIDWLKCEEFALSNRVKEACDIKRNNPEMTTVDIGEIMKLEGQTIRKYLKKGSKLGWCEYNVGEEKSKASKKTWEKRRKNKTNLIEIYTVAP